MGWRIALLGPLEVQRDGVPGLVSGARRRSLLVRLAVEAGQVIDAERLADDLWDGDPPPAAGHTLQSHISALRRILGAETVRASGGGYRLMGVRTDIEDLVAALTRGRAAAQDGDATSAISSYRAGLALWRGVALADVADAGWSLPERTRLDELRWSATEDLIDELLVGGHRGDAVASAEAAVRSQPLRERLWQQLMVGLTLTGRMADALRAYQRLRSCLDDELGLVPSAETSRLESEILQGASPGQLLGALGLSERWNPATPVPRPASRVAVSAEGVQVRPAMAEPLVTAPSWLAERATRPFVGRAAELAVLARLLEGERGHGPSIAVIHGPAGIGKTALVSQAVHRATELGGPMLLSAGICGRDGALALQPWADAVAQLGEPLPAMSPADFAGELGLASAGRLLHVERVLIEASRAGRVVVILDDLQWADPQTIACFRRMLTADAALVILATVRASEPSSTSGALDLCADLRRAATSSPSVTWLELGPLDVAAATQLAAQLTNSLPSPSLSPSLSPSSARAVADLVARSGGHPFFLTELAHAPGAVDELPSSIREVVARDLARLGDDVRALLTAAAVLGPSFTLRDVAAMGSPDADEDRALDRMEVAVGAGLVVETQADRFGFSHELIREAVLGGALDTRLRRLHRRAAALPNRPAHERARHWLRALPADPQDRTTADASERAGAVGALCEAGRLELAAGSAAGALAWFRETVALLAGLPAEVALGARIELAHAELLAGDAPSREALLSLGEQALAKRLVSLAARAALASGRGMVGHMDREDLRRRVLLADTLGLVTDEREQALLAADLAAELIGRPDEAARLADRALDLARRSGDTRTLAMVTVVGATLAHPARFETVQRALDELDPADPALVDLAVRGPLVRERIEAALRRGDGLAMRRHEAELAEIGTGAHPLTDWYRLLSRARRVQLDGDADAAEAAAREAERFGREHNQPDARLVFNHHLWSLRWQQGRLAELIPVLRRVPDGAPPLFSAHLAVAELEAGELDAAGARLGDAAATSYGFGGPASMWLATAALWALVAHRTEADDHAGALAALLRPFVGTLARATPNVYGAVAHFVGVAQLRVDPVGAEQLLRRGRAFHESLGAPWLVGQSDLFLAQAQAHVSGQAAVVRTGGLS